MTNLMSERARRMRRDKEPAERRLWYWLRELNSRGFHFRQQAPIGPYIADFCDHTAKLIIEVDGSQHGETNRLASDKRRTRLLELQGYRVLRFWNHEVLTNIGGVEVEIMLELGLISEDGTSEISSLDVPMERQWKKARGLARLRVNATRRSRQRASRTVPSPLVGEGQGGGDCRTINVGVPPTPNPSPQGGGGSARRLRFASAPISGERDDA